MTTALHIVCPHCDAINRLPRERLRDGAKCGSCHRPLYEGRPAALDSVARFDRHATHSDIPLLVDFWADLVRSLPGDGADLRTGGNPTRTRFAAGQGRQRRRTGTAAAVLHPKHTDTDARAPRPEIARKSGVMPLPQLLAWTREHVDGMKV